MQQIICAHAVIGITVTYARVRLLKSAYLGRDSPGVEGGDKLPLMERIFKSVARGLLLAGLPLRLSGEISLYACFADFAK